LRARQFAIDAQAPQFSQKDFRSADNELRDVGRALEKGSYQFKADELTKIERRYSDIEIASRTETELSGVKSSIENATRKDADDKTPMLLEVAKARMASAEHAIKTSPHSTLGYLPAVQEAKDAAKKLDEVLEISQKNNANESVSLTIWNQNQKIAASQSALELQKNQSTLALQDAERTSDARAAKVSALSASNSALETENEDFASVEEQRQKIEEIKNNFSADEAEVMKDGKKIVVRLKQSIFSLNRSELNPSSFSTLSKVEELITAVPTLKITVQGHTDSTGSDKKNQALSQERAESVKKYLISQSALEDLEVDTVGYGSARPIMTNKTKAGRASNRRVDIVIETPVAF
jgi:outer membrane protein OmpA-like peptidoglycan-associated protein